MCRGRGGGNTPHASWVWSNLVQLSEAYPRLQTSPILHTHISDILDVAVLKAVQGEGLINRV